SLDRRRLTMVIAARYISALISSTGSQESVLHRLTLEDTSDVGSSGFFRVGLAFEKGDIPAGSLPIARLSDGTPVRTAIMETNSWSDGSLRKATLVGEVLGGISGSATIEVLAEIGTQGTSGIDAFAYLTNNTDFKIQVINHSGSVSGGLPNLSYVLNINLLTASRREIQADTPVCVRVFAWGHPNIEKHLMCLHYIDLWLDQIGSVVGVEWTPVMSQHWWVDDPFGNGASPKEERSYDAVLVNGSTELEGYAGLYHAYYCQWAGLRTANDDQHARRHWIDQGAAMPTLRLAYSLESKRRLMRAGYLPPLDQSTTYTIDHGQNYEALGLNNHRAGINGTGGYEGRGVLTNMDSIAITEQSTSRWRAARVSAQASLSVFHHIKDHRLAVGGAFNGDASLGMFPQKIDRLGAQTYPGLASETIAVSGNNAELDEIPPSDAVNAPTRNGAFTSWDDAHHTVYGFMMAFVEGERYLADAVLDQLSYLNMANSFDGFISNPAAIWAVDAPRNSLQSVPNTPQYGFTHLRHRQERSFGWSQYSWDHAYALMADGDRHKPFLLNLQQTTSDLLDDSVAFFPASQLDVGTYWMRNPPIVSSFMNSMSSMLFQRSNILTENAFSGHVVFNNLLARYLRDTLVHNPYASRLQNHLVATDAENSTTYIERNERWCGFFTSADNSSGLGTTFVVGTFGFPTGVYPAENDETIVSNVGPIAPIPPELSAGTKYYLVNVSIEEAFDRGTFQISATPGGSPLTVTPQTGPVQFMINMAAFSTFNFVGENGSFVPQDDNFMTIMNAAVEYHFGATGSEVSSDDITQIRTFFAPKTYGVFANWNMNGDLMR
ncbi:MAG: hypothetical protein ACR2QF_05255, partial [Geminicoccaceae bacterium]